MLRALKASQYLSKFGWQPIVLSVNPMAYPETNSSQLKDIPSDVNVVRTFGLDIRKHFSICGRYPEFMESPDRWWTWRFSAVPSALKLIKENDIKAIWSTFPISTAHEIAFRVHSETGIPWVADFRDSMTEENYPVSRRIWTSRREIEKKSVLNARFSVFTSPSTLSMYAERYPEIDRNNWKLIYNGYDESDFSMIDESKISSDGSGGAKMLVHSGILYREDRNPLPFFQALSELKAIDLISSDNIHITLRASGNDDEYALVLEELDICDLIELGTPIPYQDALNEMMSSDGLLLFQGASCNHQIPAKVYEYFRANKQILALADTQGDTAKVLRKVGVSEIVDISNVEEIKAMLVRFINDEDSEKRLPEREEVVKFSRYSQVETLSNILDQAIL